MERHDYETRARQALRIRANDRPAGWDEKQKERKAKGGAESPWPPPVPTSLDEMFTRAQKMLTTGTGWRTYKTEQQISIIVLWQELHPKDAAQIEKFRASFGAVPINRPVKGGTKEEEPQEPILALRHKLKDLGVAWTDCMKLSKAECLHKLEEFKAGVAGG